MEYIIETKYDTGIIIASSQWFSEISEELVYSLEIILDTNGRTEVATDYSGQNWKQIWLSHAHEFVDMCNSGIVAVLIFQKKIFTGQKEKYKLIINKNFNYDSKLVHFANLEIDNHTYFAEIDGFLVESYGEKKYNNFQEIQVIPGLYELYYTVDKINKETTVNLFFKKVLSFDNKEISKVSVI